MKGITEKTPVFSALNNIELNLLKESHCYCFIQLSVIPLNLHPLLLGYILWRH